MISSPISSTELNRLHREMRSIFISGRLPYPMSSLLISLMSDIEYLENDESRPQFGFAICALSSVLLRYLAVVCIDLYVESTQASNFEVNIEIVGIIRKATDGQWLGLDFDHFSEATSNFECLLAKKNLLKPLVF